MVNFKLCLWQILLNCFNWNALFCVKFVRNHFLNMHSILRILVFLAAFFIVSHLTLAQQQDKEQADLYLEQAKLIMTETQAMDDARDLMIIAANSDTTNSEANFEAGRIHMLTVGKERASKYFLRVLRNNPGYRFDLEYWIGQSFHFGLSFERAIEYYERYRQKLLSRPDYKGGDIVPLVEVERKMQECENGKELVANPKPYSIVNVGREINSEFDDYAPVLNEDETELVFTSRRRDGNINADVFEDNKPYEDIYYAQKVDGKWKRAENIGNRINTVFHDSNLALSSDGKTLFIRKDVNGGDIFFSTRQNDGLWSPPEPIAGDVNSSYTEASVSVAKDGNTMYFSSDRPGGLGGLDIYMSTKNNAGVWTRVRNLGPKINTPDDEDSPFIDYSGQTLYFSSKGLKTMGGFDIFKSNLIDAKKNEWSDPENLGYPINTPDNDIFYVGTKDGKKGYYSSTREDGMGYEDIYLITDEVQPAKEKLLSLTYIIKVLDADTKKPLDAKVRMQGAIDNVVVGSRTIEPGTYHFQISSPSPKDYQISVEHEGYVFQNYTTRLAGASEEGGADGTMIELKKLVVGVRSVLRNIYFDYGKATFRSESYSELNKLENMLKQNENINVEISGHTDNVSSASFNLKLSQRRANAVKDFLVSKGVDTRRITAVGYGEERPIASNDDEEDGRELNRRVEFKVISN